MITGPVIQAMGLIQKIAKGDLSSKVTVKSQDEVGEMMTAMNAMVGKPSGRRRCGEEDRRR